MKRERDGPFSALLKSPFLPPFLKASYGTRGNCESTWKLLKSPTTLPWLSAASRQQAAATSHPVTETRTYCESPSLCRNIAAILCIKHRLPTHYPLTLSSSRCCDRHRPTLSTLFPPSRGNLSRTDFDRVQATLRPVKRDMLRLKLHEKSSYLIAKTFLTFLSWKITN